LGGFALETSMKLFYSATSPYVRKCLVCAHELGLRDRFELLPSAPHPVNRDRPLVARNPLGKVPTLVTDEGLILYDSRVICEFLDSLGTSEGRGPGKGLSGGRLIPTGAARWIVLVDQALADGILDAAVLVRYETAVRPESRRWEDWIGGQLDKVTCGLAEIERRALGLGERVDLGTIALACTLGYLDFRYSSLGWREKYPHSAAWFDLFRRRDSMVATQPPAS
jgi:glutathione S-transferase